MRPNALVFTNDDKERLILELPKAQLRLIGQLLHLHLADGDYNPIGNMLLNELVAQTDCVRRNPKDHRVYLNGDMPPNAIRTVNTWYLPFDKKQKEEE